jgi:hypothetical protein
MEDHISHLLRNTLRQTIKFMYTIKQQNLSNKARYKYISSFTSRKLTHPKLSPNSILTGALIGIRLASPIILGTCSTQKAAHKNHAWVYVATDATQIRVYDATAAPAISVDVNPDLGAHRHDNRPLLQCPRRGDYERTSVQHQNLLRRHVHSIVHVFQSFILIFEYFSLEDLVISKMFFEGLCSSSINSMSHVANSVSLALSDTVKFLCSSISS